MRALVIGGGISGLVAARELALAGHETTVLEATRRWGGCVGSHAVAGLTLDSGAESFATRSPAVADLAAELGIAGRITQPLPGGAWVLLPDGPRELPRTGVLGIPANPWDPEVRRSLGLAGALRASLDKILPRSFGSGGEVTDVANLVRARMGSRVLKRLVDPVVGGVHSADPALLDVDMVAPGLRAGLREHGSLAAAVAALRGANGTRTAKAGSAVAGLTGGMHTLVGALVADLETLGVALLPARRVTSVRRHGQGHWIATAGDSVYEGDQLVMALDGPAAVELLSTAVPALAQYRPAAGPDVRLVTLVVENAALDARPRGTGILVAPGAGGVQAKALTHATGKWQWLLDQAGPGKHVVRLSYGRRDGVQDAAEQGPAAVNGDRSSIAEPTAGTQADHALFETALRDASALLEVPLSKDQVRGWDVVRWAGALPFAAVGHRQRVAEVRRICAEAEGLKVVGGWVAGNGLAAVVADTMRQMGREIQPR
ncbi:FAD-dependent oxidoreductase [Pseudarthrobacter sp. J75]|uniref:protoporphyrinogen/coproporphyrinogen oxidase n=1 Tax=unclassified Pseudarthrobacter TaxID=2647000 RepID=UPI002E822C30|nr:MULTISPECIES: FAD-dependent oxidoreductase [unclassified Pseudarthrobacter]MEE2521322.1 FAD-dependent oxidoreductase [Pseudarthrobacter sp. J47]MEE2528554.1 FAD-dependent oxidoreductase [Pseudarthrobacter sp. J75]